MHNRVSCIAAVMLAASATFASVNVSAEEATFTWSELKASAEGRVEVFGGMMWFCQAKTADGKTRCTLGTQPDRPGCYAILNEDRSAWIAVDDAAAGLNADYLDPDRRRRIDKTSGWGCGNPLAGDYWLLYQIGTAE